MEHRADLLHILDSIHPADLDYQEWVNVGMALKQEGYTAADWDRWSQMDSARYHSGECFRKWESFRGSSDPVTAGTIIQMALDHGWIPEAGHELEWDSEICYDIIDSGWVEDREITEPAGWDPARELIRYLETLFEAGENVGYVTESWEKTDEKGTRWLPSKGDWSRTAGQLIQALNKCNGDIGAVLGDYNPINEGDKMIHLILPPKFLKP